MTKFIPAFLGISIAIFVAWIIPLFPPILADDIVQSRINQALPILRDGVPVEQTIVPRHNGLTSIELQLARYDPATVAGALTLELLNAQGQSIAVNTFDTRTLTHNQLITLNFPAQRPLRT